MGYSKGVDAKENVMSYIKARVAEIKRDEKKGKKEKEGVWPNYMKEVLEGWHTLKTDRDEDVDDTPIITNFLWLSSTLITKLVVVQALQILLWL